MAAGDTVSAIAGRFGVSTASVLALNGLGWKSLIFPGQVLKLSGAGGERRPAAPAPAAGSAATRSCGATPSRRSPRASASRPQAVLTANGLGWSSIIYPGQTIAIPAGATPISRVDVAPIAASDPPSTPSSAPAPIIDNTYTIVAGDTISSIAAALRRQRQPRSSAANGLSSSSIIYAGRTARHPAASSRPPSRRTARTVTPLTAEMAANARIIIQVGRELGVPDRGIVIALAAAMQESSLRNIELRRPGLGRACSSSARAPDGAPRRSCSNADARDASCSSADRATPTRDARAVCSTSRGWQSMTVAQAAQAVQISAYPDAYAKWETSALGLARARYRLAHRVA